ncbi:MAG: HAMP domain-containing histidine kinase [Pseudomonadales bacterium]|nr:HAMP domain-containing histidine kinase [Candidatus Woesebacteria bacterium]MCB9802256.1 HAMP domain-containing histidine kinase [Pseudomonadales bacterium]
MLQMLLTKLLGLQPGQFRVAPHDSYDFYICPALQHAVGTPLSVLKSTTNQALREGSMTHAQLLQTTSAIQHIMELLTADSKDTQFCIKSKLEAVVRLAESLYGAPIHTSLAISNDVLHGDAVIFEQAILCVLKNSIDASPVGSAAPVSLSLEYSKSAAVITIQDFGKGMNKLATLLALKKGVSFKYAGKGLGLPFARQVFRSMGGSMRMYSKPSLGTKTTIILPLG